MIKSIPHSTVLNGICPYFTMFPLDFPLNILRRQAQQGNRVLDPFCGRGTTNFAARLVGLYSLGIDSSPIAAAITASKLVKTTFDEIVAEAQRMLASRKTHSSPQGEFWQWAYHPVVLDQLSQFREGFLEDCSTSPRIALRGIILGALHGPKQKTFQSYFSNQCPRTYAPKPAYATRYWRRKRLQPELVDVLDVIRRRAKRYFEAQCDASGSVRLADSRSSNAFHLENQESRFDWVITSPPYYGMRTYIPDQWLRNWFVGGPDTVDYNADKQVAHSSPDNFAADLRQVWHNVSRVSADRAKMIIRFGGISDRHISPVDLIKNSLRESGWRITTICKAGSAIEGKRQADAFLRTKTQPMGEYDVWAIRD